MYTRILVSVDGSDTSKRALNEALELAKVHQSQLRIVHVVDAATLFVGDHFYADMDRLEAAMMEAGKKVLAEAAAVAEKAGLRAETQLIEIETINARVADLIVQDAKSWRAGLIVVGTHGRRGLSRVVLGSVAEGVVRAAPVPVLLVRGE
jgi:nucleotide-binding universal stress UspA family protein